MRDNGRKSQRGGFTIGLIVGLLIGLALALGVALYVTKAPNPFINKVPARSPEQDAAEAERTRNWDPNAPLAGKNPARPSSAPLAGPAAPTAEAPAAQASAPGAIAALTPPPATASAPGAAKMPPLPGDRAATTAGTARNAQPPLSTGGLADPFTYFVQAGAYSRTEDAEQQRAKLAMLGIEGRLSEREQAGRTVYRVRVGPFERKDDADAAKEKLNEAGIDSALVRVQK